jgi:hypothetical protein
MRTIGCGADLLINIVSTSSLPELLDARQARPVARPVSDATRDQVGLSLMHP